MSVSQSVSQNGLESQQTTRFFRVAALHVLFGFLTLLICLSSRADDPPMPKCPPDLVPDFVYKATGEFFKMKGDKSSLAGRVNDLVLLPKAGTKAEVHKLTVDRLKDSGGGNYKQEDGTTRTMVKNPPSDWSAPAYLNLPDNNSYKLKYPSYKSHQNSNR